MKNLREESLATIRIILEGFQLLEEGTEPEPDEEVRGRYTINPYSVGQSLIVDIRTSGDVGGDIGAVLIGREGATLAALQKTFFAALGFRMGGPGSVKQPVWLNVNGRRPDLRLNSEGGPQEPAEPPLVTITVNAPEGVRVQVATKTGS